MLFKDDYFYLSNFYKCDVALNINGKTLVFKNAQAAFEAQKNLGVANKFLLLSGLEAKKIGSQIKITTDNWNIYQLYAMAKVLNSKFKNSYLLFLLKLVKIEIVHDNYWNDTFWGVCKGEGHNILGKMLMNIRDNNNDYDKLIEYINTDLINYV